MLPHLGWLLALLPLACDCPTCDRTVICLLIAGTFAAVVVFMLAVAREFWLLNILRDRQQFLFRSF